MTMRKEIEVVKLLKTAKFAMTLTNIVNGKPDNASTILAIALKWVLSDDMSLEDVSEKIMLKYGCKTK